MVLKKSTIDRIKKIIKNHHNLLLISIIGPKALDKEQLKALKDAKIDVNKYGALKSILDLAYNHNLHNEDGDHSAPKTVAEAAKQQSGGVHQGEAHDSAIEHLDANMEQLIEKQASDVLSRIEGLVRDNNNEYRFDALQNLNRTEALDNMVKKNTVSQLKQKLRDSSKDSNRNWSRIAATEVSNAVGLGSIDRIVIDNRGKSAGEVFTYRLNPNDAATCKFCKRFYIDRDGSPKVYRLATLMGNGSNYGKKAAEWKPVSGATHPNCFTQKNVNILTESGWKPLYKIEVGEKVLTHKGVFKEVLAKIEEEYRRKPSIELRYKYQDSIQRLNVTPDHKMLTQRGWVEAQNLTLDDTFVKLNYPCKKYSFEPTKIVSIKHTKTGAYSKVYCLTVADDESFIARGVVSHNCRDSQVLELRPGFKLMPGGKVEFIGLEEWREYVAKKVQD